MKEHDEAKRIAQFKFIKEFKNTIDKFLEPILELSVKYQMVRDSKNPGYPQQDGDKIEERLLIYQK